MKNILRVIAIIVLFMNVEICYGFSWQDLWLRKDQQAMKLLKQGKAQEAAQTFESPQWQAVANYKSKNYPLAQQEYQQKENAHSHYNLGNTLALQGKYEEAIAAYDAALNKSPKMDDAVYNRELVKKLLEQEKKQPPKSQKNEDKDKKDDKKDQDDKKNNPSKDNQKQDDDKNKKQPQDQNDNKDKKSPDKPENDGKDDGKQKPEGDQQKPSPGKDQDKNNSQNKKPGDQFKDKNKSDPGKNDDDNNKNGDSNKFDKQPQREGGDNQAEQQKQQQEQKQKQDAAAQPKQEGSQLSDKNEKQDKGKQENSNSMLNDGPVNDVSNAKESQDKEGGYSAKKKLLDEETDQWLQQIPDDPGGLLRRKIMRDHIRATNQWKDG